MSKSTMPENHHKRRSRARLAAVQALYQMDVGGTQINTVIEQFTEHRIGEADVDMAFFEDVLKGVIEFQDVLDKDISDHLSAKWSFRRLDMTLRAIMRAGTYEISRRPDIPALVIVDEYVSIAAEFFEQSEPAFVNGTLDRYAKKIRAAEFGLTGQPT